MDKKELTSDRDHDDDAAIGRLPERWGAFVGEPQSNGVIERVMRTLKEQCLWLDRFTDLAHAEGEIAAFIERHSQEWLVERHGHRTPREVRAKMRAAA